MLGPTLSIHEFVRDGNLAATVEELEKGTAIDARDPATDRTPLMEAVESPRASLDLVRLLIERGADVNAAAHDKKSGPAIESLDKLTNFLSSGEFFGSDSEKKARIAEVLAFVQERPACAAAEIEPIRENVLSVAIRSGDIDKIRLLLDAGADVRYELSGRYDALISAAHSAATASDSQLLPILRLLIERGANLNTITAYSESAVRVTSRDGRFDAVKLLLDAGADPAPLQWTALMRAVALGSADDVKSQLREGADLPAQDSWGRTAWLLCLHRGDVVKAKLLLEAGADRNDGGRCGKPALFYPIENGHTPMLRWLLAEGFDPNQADDFHETALMHAVEAGITACAAILIDAGADIHLAEKYGDRTIRLAGNIEMVRLLVGRGADLNDINDEMRAAITRLSYDQIPRVNRELYQAGKHRRFGVHNPEKMNVPFWKAMVSSGTYAHAARERFNDTENQDEPVWCFRRYGKSINELPDGRVIEIAGEHEDHYDPDFCIYNDVVVHHGDGTFDIYGYPEAIFPPTDFHTATLVGKFIYIIGSLGYPGRRDFADTQVFRLDTESLQMYRIETSGQKPGWISGHKTTSDGAGRLQISGGKVCKLVEGKEQYVDNEVEYVLDSVTLVWETIT